MKETELTSESKSDRPLSIEVGQTKYTIGEYHVDFFEKMRATPVKHRIKLMNLSIHDLRAYIGAEKHAMLERVRYHFKRKWYWKDTGDEVDFSHDVIKGASFSVSQMCSTQRSIETLMIILEFFEGPDREVYTSADEQNEQAQ